MTILSGGLSLLLGVAYTVLGVITSVELVRDRRTRGFSHFGAAFAIMAFTCGPHHWVHGIHIAFEGRPPGGLDMIAVSFGMPALMPTTRAMYMSPGSVWMTLPNTTWSTAPGSMPARSMAAEAAAAPRSDGGTEASPRP